MAVRPDIRVIYDADPRLVIIDAPSTEISIQDLHDTLSTIDDNFASMSFPHTLSTSGKQDLGGGVLVGLTLQLRNTQLSFERRATLLSSGTITTAGFIGAYFQTVIDSGATFIADGVARHDIVVNPTDGSYAEVLSIDSEIQLTVVSPTGGTNDDYGIGDAYEVWFHETCNITGGNLVAVEADGDTILEPTYPTFGVGMVRASSSSATLVEQTDIQFASFEGAVHVDMINGTAGVNFPTGTPRQPVDNLTDAAAISAARGFKRLSISGNITIGTEADWTDYCIEGENPSRSTLTILAGATTVGIEILNATVTGTISGSGANISHSILSSLTVHSGLMMDCGLSGVITLTGSSTDSFRAIDCYGAGSPGPTLPKIDCGGDGPIITVVRYSGVIFFLNKTGAAATGILAMSATITLEATMTVGTFFVGGIGTVTDNSSGTTLVDNLVTYDQGIVDTLMAHTEDGTSIANIYTDLLSMASGKIVEGPSGTFKFYERDNTTVRFTLTKSGNERTRS